MQKDLKFRDEARKSILKGVNTLADAVGLTMGPKGRNALIERKYMTPLLTNDGVAIAREIEFNDKFENLGAAVLKEAAIKTNDISGDGTTSATVLAQAMIQGAMEAIEDGSNPMILREGMMLAAKEVVAGIQEKAQKIETYEDIKRVASISAGSEEFGKIIADVVEEVGRDGIITLEESNSFETTTSVVEGMQFDKGFLSPYFATDKEKMTTELINPYILITDKVISNIEEIVPVLDPLSKQGSSLLIIAEDIESEALSTLVINKINGAFNCVAVRCPGFGDKKHEILKDVALSCGATLISEHLGLSFGNMDGVHLGQADKVIINQNTTTLVNGNSDEKELDLRVKSLKNELESDISEHEKVQLKERIAKLTSGIAVIKVGAMTETEMKEAKLRFEDAINSTKAAIDKGIVAGGGTTLYHLIQGVAALGETVKENKDKYNGVAVVANAMYAPVIKISENAGVDVQYVLDTLKPKEYPQGYNAYKDEFVDMVEDGVLDPALVVLNSFKNAVSVSSTLITTDVMIADADKK